MVVLAGEVIRGLKAHVGSPHLQAVVTPISTMHRAAFGDTISYVEICVEWVWLRSWVAISWQLDHAITGSFWITVFPSCLIDGDPLNIIIMKAC